MTGRSDVRSIATDVAIVGAGPAGSSLALRLARAGHDVTLIERAPFPRTKVCGDYLCVDGMRTLRELGVAQAVLAQAQSVRSIALHGFGARLRFALPGDGAVSLPREMLDQRLLEQSCAAGAHLLRGVFLHAEERGDGVTIRYRDERGAEGRLEARVLVGADGAFSTVARRAGMAGAMRRTGRWAVGGMLRDQARSEELCMYVGRGGYYARNPLGPSSANSMLVLAKPAQATDADAIVSELTAGERRFEAEKIDKVVAIGPLRYRTARVMHGRTLLTGDAAELLDPFTGQGVATALALSAPASEAVRAVLRGERHARVARRYAADWRAIVAPRRTLTKVIDALIRVRSLRERVLRSVQRDGRIAEALFAGVSGVAPAHEALRPNVLLGLLTA